MIYTVVSVSCKKDLATWLVSAPEILKHLAAKNYSVIVPDDEVADYVRLSPAGFTVRPESELVGDIKKSISAKLDKKLPHKVGWILQQLIKMSACNSDSGEFLLIWDADTIPLKKLNFFTPDGCPVHYKGTEYHRPYFETTNRLLGMGKNVDFSFIAQSFPVRKSWITQLTCEIEARSGVPWMQAIVDALDVSEGSSFSEYETMGTYFSRHFARSMYARDARWLRFGTGLFGGIDKVDSKKLERISKLYDFVSFEAHHNKNRRMLRLFVAMALLPGLGDFWIRKEKIERLSACS